jgi:hypothetical protein
VGLRFGTDGSMVQPGSPDEDAEDVIVHLDDEDIATVIHALVIARVALRGEPDRPTPPRPQPKPSGKTDKGEKADKKLPPWMRDKPAKK